MDFPQGNRDPNSRASAVTSPVYSKRTGRHVINHPFTGCSFLSGRSRSVRPGISLGDRERVFSCQSVLLCLCFWGLNMFGLCLFVCFCFFCFFKDRMEQSRSFVGNSVPPCGHLMQVGRARMNHVTFVMFLSHKKKGKKKSHTI